YWDGDIPWVTTTLIDGAEIDSAREFITQRGLENSSTNWCKAGTILLAMYGQGKTRGKAAILSIDATINQACAAIELKDIGSSHYILHILNSMYEKIRELSNSGSQENLSAGIIKSIQIPFPPKKEQITIANALSDVDSLISDLEKLIAKKQAIKTATMQ
ncbi:restriction endonuclease subunit S, partial [Proteus mirabilis]|uniref:restriction endonuclease subunit S n=1 Tax=Proteus mirabilis TaxID=584 RepID=UPI002575086C